MTEETTGTTPKMTAEEWRNERVNKSIENMLAEVGQGWKVSLTRIRPTWCAGWVETLDHDPESPISLEYIRDMWGGQTFRVRLLDEVGNYKAQTQITIAEEPRKNGKRIKHPEEIEAEKTAMALRLAQPQQDTTVLAKMLEIMNANNQGSMALLVESLREQRQMATQNTQRNQGNGFELFNKTLDMLSNLDTFREKLKPEEKSQIIDPQIADMANNLMNHIFKVRETAQAQQQQTQQQTQSDPKPLPERNPQPKQNSGSFSDQIEDIGQKFKNVPENERAEMMRRFFEAAGMGELVDMSEEEAEDDDYEEEENQEMIDIDADESGHPAGSEVNSKTIGGTEIVEEELDDDDEVDVEYSHGPQQTTGTTSA